MVTHLTVANGQVKKGTMKSKMMTKKFKQLKAPVQQIVKKKKNSISCSAFILHVRHLLLNCILAAWGDSSTE